MDIEELVMGARAYNVLKDAGIETVEDLCLLTGEQLMHLGNFGRKSLEDVERALSEHALSLQTGAADPRLLLSFPGVGKRFNLGLSPSNRDRESLAAYTARELAQIRKSLLLLASQSTGQTRRRLLTINGHVGMLQAVHGTVLGSRAEQFDGLESQPDPLLADD
jgi:Bacterial RNA polymerase, alpha chain C terminal domain